VDVRPAGALDESLDDVRRRPELGVAPSEVDERRAVLGSRSGHAPEQGDEVLRGKPVDAGGPMGHEVIVLVPLVERLRRSTGASRRPPTTALTARSRGVTFGT
jgi:hypothetical protein